MQTFTFPSKLWWLLRKDLLREYRARMIWPAMLLLGGGSRAEAACPAML